MPKIDPIALRRSREAKRWTQQALAEKAKVDKTTISRLERGKGFARAYTVDQLCKHLEISPEVLAGDKPLEIEAQESPFDSRSQLNVRIRDGARNALTLVAARYRGGNRDSNNRACPLLVHCGR